VLLLHAKGKEKRNYYYSLPRSLKAPAAPAEAAAAGAN